MTEQHDAGQQSFAHALLEAGQPHLSGLRSWNGSDPQQRLAVHRNNVVASLSGALADTFPVVRELVGEIFFSAMAAEYVRRQPPRSRLLAQYGATFAAFVADFEPACALPYLADVARLEFARVRAFHSADVDPIDGEALAQALAGGERIGELRIVLHPSLSALASSHAIVSLWAAHQGELDIGQVDPSIAEAAIVLRDRLDVLVLRCSCAAVAFVTALLQGNGLEQAARAADAADGSFDLQSTLVLLVQHQAITSLHQPRGIE